MPLLACTLLLLVGGLVAPARVTADGLGGHCPYLRVNVITEEDDPGLLLFRAVMGCATRADRYVELCVADDISGRVFVCVIDEHVAGTWTILAALCDAEYRIGPSTEQYRATIAITGPGERNQRWRSSPLSAPAYC